MIDYTLRECPFCGNPAEVVNAEPYEWYPSQPLKAIRCSSEWCRCHSIDIRYDPTLRSTEVMAREDWNTRRRKNKLRWKNKEVGND